MLVPALLLLDLYILHLLKYDLTTGIFACEPSKMLITCVIKMLSMPSQRNEYCFKVLKGNPYSGVFRVMVVRGCRHSRPNSLISRIYYLVAITTIFAINRKTTRYSSKRRA